MVNRLGKRRRHVVSWIHVTGRGKSTGGVGPSLRETITHGRMSVQMRNGSKDTTGGMGGPRCVGTTESREIRKDGINITRLIIDQFIF